MTYFSETFHWQIVAIGSWLCDVCSIQKRWQWVPHWLLSATSDNRQPSDLLLMWNRAVTLVWNLLRKIFVKSCGYIRPQMSHVQTTSRGMRDSPFAVWSIKLPHPWLQNFVQNIFIFKNTKKPIKNRFHPQLPPK